MLLHLVFRQKQGIIFFKWLLKDIHRPLPWVLQLEGAQVAQTMFISPFPELLLVHSSRSIVFSQGDGVHSAVPP